jgi:hypothetical protein
MPKVSRRRRPRPMHAKRAHPSAPVSCQICFQSLNQLGTVQVTTCCRMHYHPACLEIYQEYIYHCWLCLTRLPPRNFNCIALLYRMSIFHHAESFPLTKLFSHLKSQGSFCSRLSIAIWFPFQSEQEANRWAAYIGLYPILRSRRQKRIALLLEYLVRDIVVLVINFLESFTMSVPLTQA